MGAPEDLKNIPNTSKKVPRTSMKIPRTFEKIPRHSGTSQNNPQKSQEVLWSEASPLPTPTMTNPRTPQWELGLRCSPRVSPRPYLAPGGAEGAIGGHGDRVQVPRVPDVVRLQLAVGQVPHLGREKRDERGQILGSRGEIPPEGPTLTLTSLSQPQDTMMGLLLLGENRTHDTHSEWLSSCGGTAPVAGWERGRSPPRAPPNQQDWGLPEIGPKPTGNDPKPTGTGPNPLGSAPSPPPRLTCTVYLQTPSVFQSLMVLSREPDTICRLSEEKATLSTSLVWPTKRRVVVPLREQQWGEHSRWERGEKPTNQGRSPGVWG